jgi:hypothetical protein
VPNLKVRDASRDFVHQINDEYASIGRGDTNTVPIQDGKASKEHCRIERFGNRWKLIDLESKNGTQLNGSYRNKAWLSHGDVILIGQAELRFGVEGGSRAAAPAAAQTRAASRKPAPARRPGPEPDYDDGYEDERPVQRRYGKSTNDKLIVVGGSLVLLVIVVFVGGKMAASMQKDTYSAALIETARNLKANDQWREALKYLQDNADPERPGYDEVLKEMKLIEGGLDDFYRRRAEEGARKVLSDLSRRIKAYDHGKSSATPEKILALVGKLKKDFASTEATQMAREKYRAWFAGKVPERASDLLAGGGQLLKDWQAAEEASYEYVKKWQFREARETIEVFLTAREAVLDPDELDKYKGKVNERLRAIDLRMDGVYRDRAKIAHKLERNKRYDDAVRVYQEIIDKFGIDSYVRKAQEEINRLKTLK